MKIIASIKKDERARYISHLDVQRSLQRTVRRANIPIAFSQGFNPHPLISFATALPVGQTGDCEWIELKLEDDMSLFEFMKRMNESFPMGLTVTNAYKAAEGVPAVATLMQSAQYTACTGDVADTDKLKDAVQELLDGEIIVKKSKKQGGKKLNDVEVDIRPMVHKITVERADDGDIKLHITGRLDASGGLNAELLLRALNEKAEMDALWKINRDSIDIKPFVYTDEAHLHSTNV
ncbi:MAG: DUF2344 domain-containing protein [Clostridia bacterium]|nr:DUF2344 domain-containing protein [Clostridia bacterium]